MTAAWEDANSKLVEADTVAYVDAEDHVGNSLIQIWELTFELNFCLDFKPNSHIRFIKHETFAFTSHCLVDSRLNNCAFLSKDVELLFFV